MSAQQEAFRSAHEAWLRERGLLKQEAFSPRPPRGGSGQSTAEESTVGYIPRSPYYEMYLHAEKEAKQLQVANNELAAEIHRLRQHERLEEEDSSPDQLTRSRESAEDSLWHHQGEAKMEKAYARGFATVAVLSTPAAVFLILGTVKSESAILMTFGIIFGAIFGLVALVSMAIFVAKLFGAIPETERQVEKSERVLSRAVTREMGLS